MQPEQIVAFFVFAVVAAITPGPSVVMVMVAGARSGFVGGLRCLAGVVAGMALLMAAATLGLGGAVLALPALPLALKWAGAALLLWMAWHVATAPPLGDVPRRQAPVGFWGALAFQWVNPKSWIVCISAAGTYGAEAHAGAAGRGARAALMAALFALAAAPSCALWLAFGTAMREWLAEPRRARVFNVAMGSALALSIVLVVR